MGENRGYGQYAKTSSNRRPRSTPSYEAYAQAHLEQQHGYDVGSVSWLGLMKNEFVHKHIAIRVISDERILGSSDFAETVLRDADEAYERKTQIRAKGPTLDYKEAGR